MQINQKINKHHHKNVPQVHTKHADLNAIGCLKFQSELRARLKFYIFHNFILPSLFQVYAGSIIISVIT